MDCSRAMLGESCDPPDIDRQKLLRKDDAGLVLEQQKEWWTKRTATLE